MIGGGIRKSLSLDSLSFLRGFVIDGFVELVEEFDSELEFEYMIE